MQPILPNPEGSPHVEPPRQEQVVQPVSPETAPNRAAEVSRETAAAPIPLAPAPASPQPLGQDGATQSATTSMTPTNDNPSLADDVDVIEKEWVDKAKKIVSATKDNPHQQEKEVSKLQADYLMKRYGKQIKTSE